ncbi:MAG: hypothetical protein M1825_004663 [Sarcosagium campestre]|nr:MAG: hypothetical protein M1825_004663 [Sarcosagium campestre]
MCKSPLHPLLVALPKVEHHVHFEGTMTTTLLFTLSMRNVIPLPANDPAYTSPTTLSRHYSTFTSLSSFLQAYFTGIAYLQTQRDFHDVAYAYLRQACSDNVRHVELSFDPQAHTCRGIPLRVVLDGLSSAVALIHENEYPISVNLIMCFLRDRPPTEALAILHEALPDFASGRLTGIGLDSAERGYPPELFADVFAMAARHGIQRTAHAGEEGPASYIASALETLGTSRIDHGIALRDDVALLDAVAHAKTLVTVCPLSNVRLCCVADVSELPIRSFLQKGVRFSINSDDPGYFDGFLQECYCAVQQAFLLSVDDWRVVCQGAIEGSWCSDQRKYEIMAELTEVIRDWEQAPWKR